MFRNEQKTHCDEILTLKYIPVVEPHVLQSAVHKRHIYEIMLSIYNKPSERYCHCIGVRLLQLAAFSSSVIEGLHTVVSGQVPVGNVSWK
jgi:hypothetical protein